MKRTKYSRVISLLLAFALLATCGCQIKAPVNEAPAKVEVGVVGETTASASIAPSLPESTPSLSASERFHELDLTFFKDYVTTDGYTIHQFVYDPAHFDIDMNTVEMTLGDFSETADAAICARYASYLETLQSINREELNQSEQMGYDVLEQYLSASVDGDRFDYYYEPLTHYSGVHTNLPLAFALYEIESEQDVKNYLLLLADLPRYFDQILQYEKERASRGMFMTASALEAIIADCNDIIDARDGFYLIATFNDAVDALADLPAEQAEAYKKQNAEIVAGPFIDAYVTLRDGLQALSSSCRAEEGIHTLGAEGLAFFEASLQSNASTDMTVDEAQELLNIEMYNLIISMSTYMSTMTDVDAAVNALNLTKGDAKTDLAFLEEIANRILPAMPAHALTLSDVPEELEKQMSPAAYVIPSVDNWFQNEILINPANVDNTMLFTYAHEAYPGHMYEYLYHRSMDTLPLSQRVISLGGYAEAWSQMSVEFMLHAQQDFPLDACLVAYWNDLILNAMLPAIVSILVNYRMYDKAAVAEYLSALGMEQLADSYYSLAVDMPFYTFEYALGYAQFASMLRDAKNEFGDAFDQKAYLTAYLDLGPAYFNLLTERMDVWVDAQIAA